MSMMSAIHVLASLSPHAARQSQVMTSANVSRLALLVWDYVINLDRERRFIWQKDFRASSALYYTIRYPVVAFQIFNLLSDKTDPHCNAYDQLCFTLSITIPRLIPNLSNEAVFVLRAYAVMQKAVVGYILVGVLAAVGALSVILDFVQTAELSCTQATSPLALVLTFISLIVFDVLATGMLAMRIVHVVRDGGGFHKLGSSDLYHLLIRSGALYYVVITALQAGAVALYFLPQGVYSTVLNNYLTPLSTILVARFLIDLREMVDVDHISNTSHPSDFSDSRLRSAGKMRFAVPGPTSAGESSTLGSGFSSSVLRDFSDLPVYRGEGTQSLSAGGSSSHEYRTAVHGQTQTIIELAGRARAVEERLVREV
ncbi:hypothetical protein EXIGLDRAFT_769133 [Exidia glandulosa HHB12029]|uniref:DUF6533 domain-containing protein n=1 Tax=Exidia glandulosa HHB12029 TaxID=1314781 RepID=A0A165HPB3_EXIGL|nr:hypothetical protein EXIGLDRAFT_769133 [Exidia glandulosa HHB12029]